LSKFGVSAQKPRAKRKACLKILATQDEGPIDRGDERRANPFAKDRGLTQNQAAFQLPLSNAVRAETTLSRLLEDG
jgi:hypothetical protein